jgi:hypothetical protein
VPARSRALIRLVRARESIRRTRHAEARWGEQLHCSRVISLQQALQILNLLAYNRRATGEKFLIAPHKAG